jgi:hypothetical protein
MIPGTEMFLSGFCTLTVYIFSKYGNVTDLSLERLVAIL